VTDPKRDSTPAVTQADDHRTVELVACPKVQETTPDVAINPSVAPKPDQAATDKQARPDAEPSQTAARDVHRARANSLEAWKRARGSHRERPGHYERNPFDDEDSPYHSRQRRDRRRRASNGYASEDGRGESTSRSRSRRRSRCRSRSRQKSRSRSRSRLRSRSRNTSRTRRRGRSRPTSTSHDTPNPPNRRRSRSARARSWLRGASSSSSSPSRGQSATTTTRLGHRASERSILFYEHARRQLSVEFAADDVLRGTWTGAEALYFRVNVFIGRGKRDYFDKMWVKLSVRSSGGDGDVEVAVPASVVKYYPERVLGPSTEESREDARTVEVGVQVGAPQPVPLNGHVSMGRSGKGSMAVQHRCRLDVTPYRGSTGVKAHLWKQRTECVMPSRVQLQFVVVYHRRAGLDIKGKLDLGGTDGADGLWKRVNTRGWELETRDFSEWTEDDWKSRGDNRLLEE